MRNYVAIIVLRQVRCVVVQQGISVLGLRGKMNILKQLYKQSDYHDKHGMIFNTDCMKFMSDIEVGGGYLTLRLRIYLMGK